MSMIGIINRRRTRERCRGGNDKEDTITKYRHAGNVDDGILDDSSCTSDDDESSAVFFSVDETERPTIGRSFESFLVLLVIDDDALTRSMLLMTCFISIIDVCDDGSVVVDEVILVVSKSLHGRQMDWNDARHNGL
jgi:hypothetical protein